jgi:hypothetical protein
LAKHPKAGDQAHCDTGEKRGPGATRRSSPLFLGKGRLGIAPGAGGIHQSIRQLRPDPWRRSLPAAIAGRAFPGAWNPGEPRSKSLAEALSANGHGHRNFEYVPVWRFGNSRARPLADLRNRPISWDSARIYFLGALGRRRCRKRTPGPPPFSSMNSTPAASKARRTAKSLAVVIDVS